MCIGTRLMLVPPYGVGLLAYCLGTSTCDLGTIRRRAAILPEQAAILRARELPEPAQFIELPPPTPA